MSRQKLNLLWLMIICCSTCQITVSDNPKVNILINSTDQCFWKGSSLTNPAINLTCQQNGKDDINVKLNITSHVLGQCKTYSFNITKHGNQYEVRMNETAEEKKKYFMPDECECLKDYYAGLNVNCQTVQIVKLPTPICQNKDCTKSLAVDPGERCKNATYEQSRCQVNENIRYILDFKNNQWTCVTCFDGNSTTVTPLSHTTTNNPTTSSTPHTTTNNPTTSSTSHTTTNSPTTSSTPHTTTNSPTTSSTPHTTTNSPTTSSTPHTTTNSPTTSSTPHTTTNSPTTSSTSHTTTNNPTTSSTSHTTTNNPTTSSTSHTTTNDPTTSSTSHMTTNSPTTSSTPHTTTNSPTTSSTPHTTTNSPTTSSTPHTTTNNPTTSSTPHTTTNSPTTSSTSHTTTNDPSTSSTSHTTTNDPTTSSTPHTTTNDPTTSSTPHTTTNNPSTSSTSHTTTNDPTTSSTPHSTTNNPSTSSTSHVTTNDPTTSSTSHTTTNNPSTSSTSHTTTNNPSTSSTSHVTTQGYTDPSKASKALDNLESKMEEMEKNNKSNEAIVTEDAVGVLHVLSKNTETKNINICYSSNNATVVESQSDLKTDYSWSVKISKEALNKSRLENNGTAFVGVLRFKKLRKDETEKHTVLNNEVYGITMRANIANLTDNIDMFFKHNDKEIKTSCVSWDGKGKLNWTTSGCETKISNNTIKCSCSHLTFFAVLMIPQSQSDANDTAPHLESLTYISYIGCGISMFFLSIALFMHFLLRKAKSNQATKILMNMFVALFLLNGSFLSNESVANTQDNAACVFIALLLHYSMLASFTWFFIQALHMYLWLLRQNVTITNYMRKITVLGWVCPAPIVTVIISVGGYEAVILNATSGKIIRMCWITNFYIHYIVNIGYYASVFVFTTGIFITILTRIVQARRLRATDGKRKTFRKQLMMVLSLFLLFGLTWSVAFFSYGPMLIPSYYIFTVLNSFQGFFLFLYYYHIHNDVAGHFSDDPKSTDSTIIAQSSITAVENIYN